MSHMNFVSQVAHDDGSVSFPGWLFFTNVLDFAL